MLAQIVGLFFLVVLVNYIANFLQEMLVGRVAENVIVDLRRAMFAHLQKISLSFMDKTEVGRVMSRLQSDTGTLQEFLETSVFAIGDLVLLLGIVVTLLILDFDLGFLAPLCASRVPQSPGNKFDGQWGTRRIHPGYTHGSEPGPGEGQLRTLF